MNTVDKVVLFCSIILISSSCFILLDFNDYSCDKCEITFYSKSVGITREGHTYNIEELFNSALKNKCLVGWDLNLGYTINEIK